jgi:hypothetical protein
VHFLVKSRIGERIAMLPDTPGLNARGQFQKGGAFLSSRTLHKQHRSLSLQRFAHHEVTLYILPRGNTEPRTGAGPPFQQAIPFQTQEGFRRGQEAHSQLCRNPAPRQDLAGRKIALHNSSMKDLVGRPGQTAAVPR